MLLSYLSVRECGWEEDPRSTDKRALVLQADAFCAAILGIFRTASWDPTNPKMDPADMILSPMTILDHGGGAFRGWPVPAAAAAAPAAAAAAALAAAAAEAAAATGAAAGGGAGDRDGTGAGFGDEDVDEEGKGKEPEEPGARAGTGAGAGAGDGAGGGAGGGGAVVDDEAKMRTEGEKGEGTMRWLDVEGAEPAFLQFAGLPAGTGLEIRKHGGSTGVFEGVPAGYLFTLRVGKRAVSW
jgi:hypothetical protein